MHFKAIQCNASVEKMQLSRPFEKYNCGAGGNYAYLKARFWTNIVMYRPVKMPMTGDVAKALIGGTCKKSSMLDLPCFASFPD